MVIINNCTLIGRLTREPELRYLPNGGKAVCNFGIAVDKGLSKEKKQEMEGQGKYTADFINIVVWGKQGENCANYLAKGRLVGIQGRIQTGSYNAKDGSKRYTFDIVAEKTEFLEWADKNEGNNNSGSNNNTSGFNGDGFTPVDDDEIPF